jgi:hypothetical protein
MELHETCMAILSEFESAYADLAQERGAVFTKHIRHVEKEEVGFREEGKSHLWGLVGKMGDGNPILTGSGLLIKPDELEAETLTMLQDRETAAATVGSSHDFRMAKLLKEEDMVSCGVSGCRGGRSVFGCCEPAVRRMFPPFPPIPFRGSHAHFPICSR